jgi:hypothetical protein
VRTKIWVVLLTPVAVLALSATAGASGGSKGPNRAAQAPQAVWHNQTRQYHAQEGRQYHLRASTTRRISARGLGSTIPGAELRLRIAARLISPFSIRYSKVSRAEKRKPSLSRSISRNTPSIAGWIAAGNCSKVTCLRSISVFAGPHPKPKTTDTRLMLQIGGLFGMLYLAFLAVWLWATRFRTRPPRAART